MTDPVPQDPPADHRPLVKRALLTGAARALGLVDRLPTCFRLRGWRQDDGAMDIAGAALCYTALANQAIMNPERRRPELYAQISTTWLRVPEALYRRKEWAFAVETEGKVTAAEVVAHLDLKHLLKPAK